MELIRFEGVSKYYNGKPALHKINLSILAGETLVLLGPSGCGKTTLLKLINGLIIADKGQIHYREKVLTTKDVQKRRRKMGYVIQDVGLFPHLTVAENLLMPLKISNIQGSRDLVINWLDKVGLTQDIKNKFPSELSGGQQQRVGIARALINDPELLLMDEPFSALDNITRLQLQEDFLQLESLLHKTTVLVTHDVQEAFTLGDRVAILNEGVIHQVAQPLELLLSPKTAFVEEFLSGERLLLELKHLPVGKTGTTVLDCLQDPAKSTDQKKLIFDQYLDSKRSHL